MEAGISRLEIDNRLSLAMDAGTSRWILTRKQEQQAAVRSRCWTTVFLLLRGAPAPDLSVRDDIKHYLHCVAYSNQPVKRRRGFHTEVIAVDTKLSDSP